MKLKLNMNMNLLKYSMDLRTKTFLSLFLITVLTSFLQSYLDKIRKEEDERQVEGGFMDTIKQIGRFFKTLKKRFANFAKGWNMIGAALNKEVIGIGKTGELLVDNTVKIANCVGQKINNFNTCSKYYFLDVIADTLYGFFITLPLYIIQILAGINLFHIEKKSLKYAKNMNIILKDITNISLSSYPDSVLDKCYRCNPKLPSQKEQNEQIRGFLEKPINDMGDGFKKVFSIFS